MTIEPTTDIQEIREAISELVRRLSHPKTREILQQSAGVKLDKVSEVVLTIVQRCKDTDPRLSDLADMLGVELSSVSRKVQKLEEVGHLERTTDPKDGRASRLHITPSGTELLEKLGKARGQLMNESIEHWSDADRKKFTELLTRFTSDLFEQVENRSN